MRQAVIVSDISESAVVYVKNVGDRDFVDRYDGRLFEIPAGSMKPVPFGAVCVWFGHPHARNEDPSDISKRARIDEYNRVLRRYGLSDPNIPASAEDERKMHRGEPFTKAGDVRTLPQVEVFYEDASSRMVTPLEDPLFDPQEKEPDLIRELREQVASNLDRLAKEERRQLRSKRQPSRVVSADIADEMADMPESG